MSSYEDNCDRVNGCFLLLLLALVLATMAAFVGGAIFAKGMGGL